MSIWSKPERRTHCSKAKICLLFSSPRGCNAPNFSVPGSSARLNILSVRKSWRNYRFRSIVQMVSIGRMMKVDVVLTFSVAASSARVIWGIMMKTSFSAYSAELKTSATWARAVWTVSDIFNASKKAEVPNHPVQYYMSNSTKCVSQAEAMPVGLGTARANHCECRLCT